VVPSRFGPAWQDSGERVVKVAMRGVKTAGRRGHFLGIRQSVQSGGGHFNFKAQARSKIQFIFGPVLAVIWLEPWRSQFI